MSCSRSLIYTSSSCANRASISESPRDPNVLYVGSDDGGFWMTRDGGHTWVDLYAPRLPPLPPGWPMEPAERAAALGDVSRLGDWIATYEREIAWYRGLRERLLGRLGGEERRWFEWAVDSAIQTATAARDRAMGSGRELGAEIVPLRGRDSTFTT